MIYTVTLNPSLDYTVSVKEFALGKTNRTDSEQIFAGGKGINVSIVLKNLGVESIALGFIAGFTGDEIVRQLDNKGITTDFVKISEGASRINLKLKSIEGTEINGSGPKISKPELEALMQKLKTLKAGDILFLAGSIPKAIPSNTYMQIAEMMQDKGVLAIVDSTKESLLKTLPYRPFLIKPNKHELGEIFGVQLNTRQDVIAYGRKLQEMGARNVLVSLAGEGAVLIAEDGQLFSAPAPHGELKNGVGAGDSMVAGFVAGWLERQDYEYAFYMGLAAGSASAFSEELATEKEIREVFMHFRNGMGSII